MVFVYFLTFFLYSVVIWIVKAGHLRNGSYSGGHFKPDWYRTQQEDSYRANFIIFNLATHWVPMQEDECLRRSRRSLGEKVIHRDQRDMAGKVNRHYMISCTHVKIITLLCLISCSKQINFLAWNGISLKNVRWLAHSISCSTPGIARSSDLGWEVLLHKWVKHWTASRSAKSILGGTHLKDQ